MVQSLHAGSRTKNSSTSAHKALKRLSAVALVLALAFVLVGCGDGFDRPPSGDPSAADVSGMTQATVVRVVDGDTLQVKIDGQKHKVRLIGINCPESVATEQWRNTEEGVDASSFTKSLLSEGDTVWLQSDRNDVDQYDRLLRYVWIEQPVDRFDEDEVAGKMLNAILVGEGYAEARVYGKDDLYANVLDELERQAVREGLGVSYMWA